MGVREAREEGPGRYLAGSPLPSLSKPATPSHQTLFRAQASPPLSLWAKQTFGKWARGGRLKPVPLKGTSTLHTCQARECPECLPWGKK